MISNRRRRNGRAIKVVRDGAGDMVDARPLGVLEVLGTAADRMVEPEWGVGRFDMDLTHIDCTRR